MSNALLEVKNLTMQFGGLRAVDHLSFSLAPGSLSGLIGPNGAGKTTVFNMLTGVYAPIEGEVLLNGNRISGLKPFEINAQGVARTFQNIRLFKELTVLENILIAQQQHCQASFVDILLQNKRFISEESALRKQALDLLSLFSIEKKANEKASSLPYGEQRQLEIVRALATKPKLILLDEPAAGMNHRETNDLMKTIAKIRQDFQLTVLLIEHDMKLVMGVCENIVVLDHGCKIEEGTPIQIKSSKKVIEAYLGPDLNDGEGLH